MKSEYILCCSPGSSALVSLIALEECGVYFDVEYARDYQPVPVLNAPRGVISENIAIVSYLARRHPKSRMLPSYNSYSQAQALSLMSWCASSLDSILDRIHMAARVCDMSVAQKRVRELAMGELGTQLDIAETRLEGGPWLLGRSWSIADTYLYWVWSRSSDIGFNEYQFPRLARHASQVLVRPSTQRALKFRAVAAAA
jgi:glutathione S-transferase